MDDEMFHFGLLTYLFNEGVHVFIRVEFVYSQSALDGHWDLAGLLHSVHAVYDHLGGLHQTSPECAFLHLAAWTPHLRIIILRLDSLRRIPSPRLSHNICRGFKGCYLPAKALKVFRFD